MEECGQHSQAPQKPKVGIHKSIKAEIDNFHMAGVRPRGIEKALIEKYSNSEEAALLPSLAQIRNRCNVVSSRRKAGSQQN